MNHQITLEELGIITEQKTCERKQYATPCGGCICNHCLNNVDCIDHMEIKECLEQEPCFNCDMCLNYSGYGKDNRKRECERYVITNEFSKKKRSKIHILKKGE